jgi:hypothetical protein
MARLMPAAQDGDTATYQQCTDPACPARRPGTEHAHLVTIQREDGEVEVIDAEHAELDEFE